VCPLPASKLASSVPVAVLMQLLKTFMEKSGSPARRARRGSANWGPHRRPALASAFECIQHFDGAVELFVGHAWNGAAEQIAWMSARSSNSLSISPSESVRRRRRGGAG
jgi:hypothetical protein